PLLCSLLPPPPVISTLSLHDALPIFDVFMPRSRTVVTPAPSDRIMFEAHLYAEISGGSSSDCVARSLAPSQARCAWNGANDLATDRKSTRLNSSHVAISYAVFCLKKK